MSSWPVFDEEQIADVVAVLRSGRVNAWTGNHVSAFEASYASHLGRRHAIALANGTVALDLAMLALGVSEGDMLRVSSPRGSVEAPARLRELREGVVFIPFHYGYWDVGNDAGPVGNDGRNDAKCPWERAERLER